MPIHHHRSAWRRCVTLYLLGSVSENFTATKSVTQRDVEFVKSCSQNKECRCTIRNVTDPDGAESQPAAKLKEQFMFARNRWVALVCGLTWLGIVGGRGNVAVAQSSKDSTGAAGPRFEHLHDIPYKGVELPITMIHDAVSLRRVQGSGAASL